MMFMDQSKHTSAQGVLAQLADPSRDVQIYALKKLDTLVHYAWHEIADHVSKMFVPRLNQVSC